MTKENKLNKQYPLPHWYKVTVATVILIVVASPVILIGYFLYWRSGLPNYDTAVRECGGKQPIETSAFMGSTYELPSDKFYKIPNDRSTGSLFTTYFCTEADAKAAGYMHTPLGG